MKRYAAITAAVLTTLATLLALWQLRGALLLFFLSLGVAAALRPLVDRLESFKWPRLAALAMTYLATLALLTGLAMVAAGPLMTDLERLEHDAETAFAHARNSWPNGGPLQRKLVQLLPVGESLTVWAADGRWLASLPILLGFTRGFVEIVVNTIVMAVLSLYWSVDRVYFERLWLSLLAVDHRTAARDAWRTVEIEVGAYLRSEAIQCVAAGAILGLGYSAMQFPYPVLLAVCSAAAWLVPWGGVVIALALTAVLSLPIMVLDGQVSLDGQQTLWSTALPAMIATVLVLSFLELVVEPRLFDRRRYNALLIMLVVIVLTEGFGIAGLLLGPPLAAAIQTVGGYWLRRRAVPQSQPLPPPALAERVAALRASLAAQDAPPELASLVDRLSALVQETGENLPPAAALDV
ncbi:MAG TPA: AI-2E family transporter [Pirellulales bacterium]|nr:AI-2E family transporter [Pirellulales bacterium]